MKHSHLRHKNRLNQNFGCILVVGIPYLLFCLFIITYSITYFTLQGLVMGIAFLIPLVVFLQRGMKRRKKVLQFLQDANDFQDNDTWLPHHYAARGSLLVKRIEKPENLDDIIKEKGVKEVSAMLKLDLEYLYDLKSKIESISKKWKTIPIPSRASFNDPVIRMDLPKRTAIYNKGEREDIDRAMIDLADECDGYISKSNALSNKLILKEKEVKRSIDDISIDGLNISDE